MSRVKDVVKELLSFGEDNFGSKWSDCPNWPPDLFAIAATLLKKSGCYANCPSGKENREAYKKEVKTLGERWAKSGKISRNSKIRSYWKTIINEKQEITESTPQNETWWDAAFRLLAIADEASERIGFILSPDEAETDPSIFVLLASYAITNKEDRKRYLPHWPRSICQRIGQDQLCVQPKSRKPQVGCTLRALSHNLALLPPSGEVNAFWRFSRSSFKHNLEPLNFLLIPFPYNLKTNEFYDSSSNSRTGKYFSLNQNWIPSLKEMVKFTSTMILEAEKNGEKIGAVVFPELAFTLKFARELSKALGKEFKKLEVFIAGVSEEDDNKTNESKNSTYTCLFQGNGKKEAEWTQGKHHRWCLNRSQIERYKLSGVLNPARKWWENIKIGEYAEDGRFGRTAFFYQFRHRTILTTLVCEDLARIEPMQGILREIGPNLVIALLLDGSQLKYRWPARYATVFADDPGSTVLTFTSLGMIFRGDPSIKKIPAKIALWQESNANIKELELPSDHHALLLNCCFEMEENITFDGRSDDSRSVKISLAGVRAVKLPNPEKYSWLDDPRIP